MSCSCADMNVNHFKSNQSDVLKDFFRHLLMFLLYLYLDMLLIRSTYMSKEIIHHLFASQIPFQVGGWEGSPLRLAH